jgi:hypothetical protein
MGERREGACGGRWGVLEWAIRLFISPSPGKDADACVGRRGKYMYLYMDSSAW